MKYHPDESDEWGARLSWLIDVQEQLEMLIREVFPESLGSVSVHLYHGNDNAEAQDAARVTGFALIHGSGDDEESQRTFWYQHGSEHRLGTGEVCLFLDRAPLPDQVTEVND